MKHILSRVISNDKILRKLPIAEIEADYFETETIFQQGLDHSRVYFFVNNDDGWFSKNTSTKVAVAKVLGDFVVERA